MSKVKSLLKRAWSSLSNPGQDERVPHLVAAIDRAFREQGASFDLDQVLAPIDCTFTDVSVASSEYYSKLLKKYWQKGTPDANRKKTLAVVANRLHLDGNQVSELNNQAAVAHLGKQLEGFLEDGVIDDEELDSLKQTASFVDTTVHEMVRQHLSDKSFELLRGVFSKATATGRLDRATWKNLVASANRLGVTEKQLRESASTLARSFAEHVLADTKADGVLSPEEDKYLQWLRSTFVFNAKFDSYLESEIESLRTRTELASGNVPTISPPAGVNLRAGEIPHLYRACTLTFCKQLKSGPKTYRHEGNFLLTDCRVVFQSATHSVQFGYAKIIGWEANARIARMSVTGKPELTFTLKQDTNLLLEDRLTALIRLHSQRLRKKVDGKVDRHIPRDVRQRVWQRYGGKCADCDATEYLEFDHIVPVAKGGSNSEQNVQLLCRRCNLSKSDKI